MNNPILITNIKLCRQRFHEYFSLAEFHFQYEEFQIEYIFDKKKDHK